MAVRPMLVPIAVVAAFAMTSACGSGSAGDGAASNTDGTTTSASSTPAVAGRVVRAHDLEFKPDHVTIAVGEAVTWKFDDGGLAHNVVADKGDFKSKVLKRGTFSHTFPNAGTFAYVCTLHPQMKGEVEVR